MRAIGRNPLSQRASRDALCTVAAVIAGKCFSVETGDLGVLLIHKRPTADNTEARRMKIELKMTVFRISADEWG
jgi:hypothetical protein